MYKPQLDQKVIHKSQVFLTTEFFNFGRKKPGNLCFRNGHFSTFSGYFFANYMNIFHKTEVQTVILRCQMGLNLIWFKNYDPKRKFFHFRFFCDFVKNKACKKTPLLHNVFFLFFNWVKTFEPIMI